MNIEYYNHKFKMEVIDNAENQSMADRYKSFFKKTIDIENKYGKDVYEFDQEEIQEILNKPELIVSRSTFKHTKSMLKKYFEYAAEHSKPANGKTLALILSLNYDSLDMSQIIRTKFFRSYMSMATVFDNLIRSSKEQSDTEDNFIIERMCCVAGLIWWGVEPEDIVELTEQDIDRNKMTIYLKNSNKRMPLPEILIDQCLALSQYDCIKRATGVGVGTFSFANNDKIIKIKKTNREGEAYDMLQNIRQNFMPVFNERLKTLPENLQKTYKEYVFQYRDIIRNGRFEKYYNKEQSESQLVPTYNDYMITFGLERVTAFNEFKTYRHWKKAYNLN